MRSAMNMDAYNLSVGDVENFENRLEAKQPYLGGLSSACFGDESCTYFEGLKFFSLVPANW